MIMAPVARKAVGKVSKDQSGAQNRGRPCYGIKLKKRCDQMFGIFNGKIKYRPKNNEQKQTKHNFFTPGIFRIL